MSRMVMKRAVLLSVVAVIGVLFLVPGSATAAPRRGDANAGCRVTSRMTHAHFAIGNSTSPLDSAIAAAPAADTLRISGTCVGTFEVTQNLTLVGHTTSGRQAVLDARQCGTVLTVTGATVHVVGIRLTGGADGFGLPCGDGSFGGGLVNTGGAVSLSHVRIDHNRTQGGIRNLGGAVTLSDSIVTQNSAFTAGGGIASDGGSLTIARTTISDNSALMGGGVWTSGTDTTFADATVTANAVIDQGGGVLAATGSLTLTNTEVSGNSAGSGAGIAVFDSSLAVAGTSSVRQNAARESAGGILSSGTTVTVPGWTGTVSDNTHDNCAPTLTLGVTTCS